MAGDWFGMVQVCTILFHGEPNRESWRGRGREKERRKERERGRWRGRARP